MKFEISLYNLEKFLLYFLIFVLPLNIKKFLFELGSFNFNFQSAFLNLSEILIVLLIVVTLLRLKKNFFLYIFGDKKNWLLGVFLAISFLSTLQAKNLGLSLYYFFGISLAIFFYFYLKTNINLFDLKKILFIIVFSSLIQILISDLQFHFQKSLGLKFLGESPVASTIPGVAKIDLDSAKFIRSYGTFPHPNLLAVFLYFSLLIFYGYYLKYVGRGRGKDFPISFVAFFIILGIFFTFSRTALLVALSSILIFFLMTFYNFFIVQKKSFRDLSDDNKILNIFLVSTFSLIFLFLIFGSLYKARIGERESFTLRKFYNEQAFSLIKKEPLLGVGPGNFIENFKETLPAWQYQPVHNFYLLIASETGLISLLTLLIFLFLKIKSALKKINEPINLGLIILIFGFLFLGFFDHYFWTLPQGRLIFWLLLALI